MTDRNSFEATYPRYTFSGLVDLGLALARWIEGLRHRRTPAARHGEHAAA